MSNHKLNVSDLDFDQIKTNLKTFLQAQTQFQDYNFEGSGLSILLDVLSYNTHYLSFIANMSMNETYLDSADIRNNIVSLAKMIGYTPSSPRAPRASIDILVNNASGASLTMNKGTVFTTSVDETQYQYVTNEDITISPVSGVYNFSDVTIYEGTLVTFKYTYDANDPDQRFIIPNENVDTTTLKVSVQTSSGDTTTSTYSLAGGYNQVTPTSNVYFIQEAEDGKFEIYFGDGVVGNALDDGNIVIMEYVVTNKTESNGATSFSLNGTIGGFSNVAITTNSSSQGGAEAETKESIKFNAPLNYAAQDRAVTTTDYEALVRSIYPNAISVSAWGGEDDETPRYGVVRIAIKAASGSTLTDTTKNDIITALKPYNVASVRPEIIDPEITSLILNVNARYDAKTTTKTADTLKSEIINEITNYNTSSLQQFDGIFRYSKLTGLIDDTDDSILSNITTVKMRKTFTPTLSTSTRYDVYFRNGIYHPHDGHQPELESSGFKVTGSDNEFFLDDDGRGNIRRYYIASGIKTYVNNQQGIINYTTGQITINSLNVADVSNIRGAFSTVIELTTRPSSYDVVPVRDQIIEIDVANSTVTVQADTFIGGSSDAGIDYTTTNVYS